MSKQSILPTQTVEVEANNASGMRYWRQMDIVSTDALKAANIVLIGAGSVGSFTALALAKMGIGGLEVYDDDRVEDHNLPNQFFKNSDIGKSKAEALVNMLKEMTEVKDGDVGICLERWSFKNKPIQRCIVISCVDSMKSRAEIWTGMKYNPNVELYIDSRMGAEILQVFALNPSDPNDVDFYQNNLFPDSEASTERCTYKAIIYNVLCLASFICADIKKYINSEKLSREIAFDFHTMGLMI